jgi:hypothetical protein
MSNLITPTKAMVVSIVFGALVWAPLVLVNRLVGAAPNDAWTLWYWTAYPAILVGAWYLGHRIRSAAWRFGASAVAASYVAALVVVPQSGSLLPFELLLMGVLAVGAALVGSLGGRSNR